MKILAKVPNYVQVTHVITKRLFVAVLIGNGYTGETDADVIEDFKQQTGKEYKHVRNRWASFGPNAEVMVKNEIEPEVKSFIKLRTNSGEPCCVSALVPVYLDKKFYAKYRDTIN